MFQATLDWIRDSLPDFHHPTDVVIRTREVSKYARWCLIFTAVLLCILHPIWLYLTLTNSFFKVYHSCRRHIYKRIRFLHRLPTYHNRSLRYLLFWSLVCLVFSFVNTKQDLLHATKRLGRVAVALMPPLLFLTLRPSPLPHTLYLALLPIHKAISRVVVLASLLHTIFYCCYMRSRGVLLVKILKPANMYGVLAMLLFILIAITSIWKFRRYNFKLFYCLHYVATWLTVIFIYLHARPGVPYYTLLSVSVLCIQILYRVYHTRLTRVTILRVSKNLTVLEFPATDLVKKPVLPAGHVRMLIRHRNPLKRWFFKVVPLQHPFTLASLPNEDTAKLIIRNGNFPLVNNHEYYVTGSFEPIINFIDKVRRREGIGSLLSSILTPKVNNNPFHITSSLLYGSPLNYLINARRVLMCVGGSAISFALPLLRILNFNGVTTRLIWVTRDYQDLNLLNCFTHNFEGMEVYISAFPGTEQDIVVDYDDCDDEDSLRNDYPEDSYKFDSSSNNNIGDDNDKASTRTSTFPGGLFGLGLGLHEHHGNKSVTANGSNDATNDSLDKSPAELRSLSKSLPSFPATMSVALRNNKNGGKGNKSGNNGKSILPNLRRTPITSPEPLIPTDPRKISSLSRELSTPQASNYGSLVSVTPLRPMTPVIPTTLEHVKSAPRPVTPAPEEQYDDEIDFSYAFTKKSRRKNKKRQTHSKTVPTETASQSSDNSTSSSSSSTKMKFTFGSAFRKPVYIEPRQLIGSDSETTDPETGESPDLRRRIRIPAGVKIFSGRPALDSKDYEWCLRRECDVPDDLQCFENQDPSIDSLSQVWVVAAGPIGLVSNTRRFAKDAGLHFHEESFAV